MTWGFFAVSSIFFFTGLALLQRKIAVNSNNARAMAVIFNLSAFIIALIIFFIGGSYKNISFPKHLEPYIFLLVASFCYGMYERGRFMVAKLLDASVFSTILNTSVLVAFIGSFFLYNEALTLRKIVGGILIIFALFLISFGKKIKGQSKKGIGLGILISVIIGIAWMLDKKGTQFFNADTYNILVWLIPIFFIVFPYIKLREIKEEFKLGSWKIILLAGINVAGYYLQLKALEIADATKVIPIVQTSTLLTVFLGILILKEKKNILRKIIAGLITIMGVYLLV